MDITELKKHGWAIFKKDKENEDLPLFSHPKCGPLSQSQVRRTKKGGFTWHCPVCGETRFFWNLNIAECSHTVEEKMTKNNFITTWCPVCRIRVFKRPPKGELVETT